MSTSLPAQLSQAIEAEAERFPIAILRRAVACLSERYRLAGGTERPYVNNELDAVAYVAFRMPATYAAMHSVIGQLRLRMPVAN